MAVNGGDDEIEANGPPRPQGTNNWRSEWTDKTLEDIRSGGVKRVRLLSSIPENDQERVAAQHPDSSRMNNKKIRTAAPAPNHDPVSHTNPVPAPPAPPTLTPVPSFVGPCVPDLGPDPAPHPPHGPAVVQVMRPVHPGPGPAPRVFKFGAVDISYKESGSSPSAAPPPSAGNKNTKARSKSKPKVVVPPSRTQRTQQSLLSNWLSGGRTPLAPGP